MSNAIWTRFFCEFKMFYETFFVFESEFSCLVRKSKQIVARRTCCEWNEKRKKKFTRWCLDETISETSSTWHWNIFYTHCHRYTTIATNSMLFFSSNLVLRWINWRCNDNNEKKKNTEKMWRSYFYSRKQRNAFQS